MASDRIAIDPALLMSQSVEMMNLTEAYDHLFSSVSSSLTTMNTRWSANLSNNFVTKIQSARSSFDVLDGLLRGGAHTARESAERFLSVDQAFDALKNVFRRNHGGGGHSFSGENQTGESVSLYDYLFGEKKKQGSEDIRGTGERTAETAQRIAEDVSDAAQNIPVEPDNKVTENTITGYSEPVERGRIRWVDQTGSVENNATNGWGQYNNLDYGWYDGAPSSQCNSACESMALSYLGVDRSPGSLVPDNGDTLGGLEVANYGTVSNTWLAPDGSEIRIDNYSYCAMEDINSRVEEYMQDGNKGDVAPVMVRFQTYDGSNGHWILLTGKNDDGTYSAVGPGGEKERGMSVTIDQNGNIRGDSLSHGGGYIHRYAQYTRQN